MQNMKEKNIRSFKEWGTHDFYIHHIQTFSVSIYMQIMNTNIDINLHKIS